MRCTIMRQRHNNITAATFLLQRSARHVLNSMRWRGCPGASKRASIRSIVLSSDTPIFRQRRWKHDLSNYLKTMRNWALACLGLWHYSQLSGQSNHTSTSQQLSVTSETLPHGKAQTGDCWLRLDWIDMTRRYICSSNFFFLLQQLSAPDRSKYQFLKKTHGVKQDSTTQDTNECTLHRQDAEFVKIWAIRNSLTTSY